jgi:hypothetical protein
MKYIAVCMEPQSKLDLENRKRRIGLNWLWILPVVDICDYGNGCDEELLENLRNYRIRQK